MRQKRFDLAKGTGILLVVMGHLEYISEPLRYFIVSFHMPLFFVISGMLMRLVLEEKKERRRFIKRKLKRMALPYLVYSALYLIIEVIYGQLTGSFEKWTLVQDAWMALSLYGISVLWFLPAMFFGMLLLYFIRRHTLHRVTVMTVIVLTVSMYFSCHLLEQYKIATVYDFLLSELYYPLAMIVRSFFALFYLAAGYYMQAFVSRTRLSPCLATKLLIAALLFAIVAYLSQVNGAVDIHFLIFGNPVIYLFNSLAGSVAVLLLAAAAERAADTIPGRVAVYYGVHSLTVMATHINFYVMYASIIFVMHLMKYITHAKGYLFCPLIVVVVFLLEAVIIEAIEAGKKLLHKISMRGGLK